MVIESAAHDPLVFLGEVRRDVASHRCLPSVQKVPDLIIHPRDDRPRPDLGPSLAFGLLSV
jgi:hypothetical protein